VTRFQDRKKPVIYEIAQVTLIVENTSPESDGINSDGIIVYAEDKASISQLLQISAKYYQAREIKYHLTPSGLLFSTLSLDAPSFEEYFVGLEVLTNTVDFTKLPHRRSISYSGRFNWKTMSVSLPLPLPQLTAQDRWLPRVPPLPIHTPHFLQILPTNILLRNKPLHILPTHRRPVQNLGRIIPLLLPDLHPERLRRRHVFLPHLPGHRTWMEQDGVRLLP
jgi:hypothetical protein